MLGCQVNGTGGGSTVASGGGWEVEVNDDYDV